MSDTADIKTNVGTRGLEYFRAHATINKHGVATLTQKQYFDFHKAEGIDRDVIDRYTAAENELLNGAYLYVNELMRNAAKEAGVKEDSPKVVSKVRITKPFETVNLASASRVVCRIPLKPEAIAAGKESTTTKYGLTTIRIDRERAIEVSVIEQCSASAQDIYK